MFKKKEALRKQSLIKNSQIKKIVRDFNDQYNSEIQLKNLQYSNFTTFSVYSSDNPVLIELPFQNQLIPSIYLCWQYPILPLVLTPKQVITNYLYNGADLMVPGIIAISREFEEGDIVGITFPNNPYPLVIGKALKSSSSLANETEGKAIQNLHYYGDCLWEMGDKSDPPEFIPDVAALTLDSVDPDVTQDTPQDEQHSKDNTELQEVIITAEDMDLLFEKSFLTSIIKLEDNQFPMTSTIFYSNHMLPNRPEGSTLDIKKSSFKRLTKLLKSMEKKGLIKTKEKNGELFVMSVCRNHPLIAGKEPPKEKKIVKQENKHTVKYQELYKLPSNGPLKRLVQELNSNEFGLEYYDADSVNKLLNAYYSQQNLVDPSNGRNIRVDAYIYDALLTKQEYSLDYMQRDLLKDRFIQKMQPFYSLELPSQSIIKRGKLQPITIQIKRRQGNKMVTLINNLETFLIDPEEFSERLKIKCASSSSVNIVDKRTQVMVQGSNTKQVVDCLKEIGFPITMQNDKLMPNKFVLAVMEKPVINPLNQIELQAERMSKDLVELLHAIDSRLQDYAHYTSESIEIQKDATQTLCDQINTAVKNGSKLIQSMDEIMLSIDSLYSLGNEIKLFSAVLSQLEVAYEQKKNALKLSK